MRARRINWRNVLILTLAFLVPVAGAIAHFHSSQEVVKVCNNRDTPATNPHYGEIIVVHRANAGAYAPVDDPACAKR